MHERGERSELELLRQFQVSPSYHSASGVLRMLFEDGIQRIQERIREEDRPDTSHNKSEEATPLATLRDAEEEYQRHKAEWDQQYAGQYVAVHRGKVIDSDKDKTKLMAKLIEKQLEIGPLHAGIIQVEGVLSEDVDNSPDKV